MHGPGTQVEGTPYPKLTLSYCTIYFPQNLTELISTMLEQMGILSARARPNGRSNTKWRHFVRQCALNGISNLDIDGLATLSEED